MALKLDLHYEASLMLIGSFLEFSSLMNLLYGIFPTMSLVSTSLDLEVQEYREQKT